MKNVGNGMGDMVRIILMNNTKTLNITMTKMALRNAL